MEAKEIDADFGKKTRRIYLICCMIGSSLTLYSRNIFYRQYSYTFEGCGMTLFNYPWFTTLMMSLGMSFANILYKLLISLSKEPMVSFSNVPFSIYLRALVPAALDIIFSVFYSISILLIGSTLSTIIRFLDLVFATLLRRFWLKIEILPYQWTSILVIIIGVIIVSLSVTIGTEDLTKMQFDSTFIVALVLQILAQSASSFKAISEEQLLHLNDIHPFWLCGVEGVYEFVMILFMLDPILNFMPESNKAGLSENFCEAVLMVVHSTRLIWCFFVYLFIACFFNCCVMGVEFTSSAVHFIVSENVASCISWGIDLIIQYAMDGSIFGLTEKTKFIEWNKMSYLRLVGVILIILGSLVYVKVFKFPFFRYEESSVKIISVESQDIENI